MVQDKGQAVVAIMWTFVAISTVFMAARLFTRVRFLNTVGPDDYIIGASLLLCYIFTGLITGSVAAGTGEHSVDLSDNELHRALLLSTAAFVPGILSFTIPKLGVVALLTRILNPSFRLKAFLWALVGGSNLIIFGCVIILYAQCQPTRALWTPSMQGTKCWSSAVLMDYSIATGAVSAFVDLFLAVYPATVLWRLQMTRKKKIGLSITLGLGVCACAVSIYKSTRLTGLGDKPDFTYSTADVYLWTNIEANTIIMAACVPTITPLLEMLFGKRVLGSRSGPQSSVYVQGSAKNESHNRNGGSVIGQQYHHSSYKNKWSASTTERGADLESQKSILGDEDIPLDQITRTDQVIIEYETADGGGIRRSVSSWRKSFGRS